MSLTKFKAESQSRYAEEKKIQERRKNLMVMIYKHLVASGYLDSAVAMERECNVKLEAWELADNMDLAYVLQDFEEYFELKFMRKPVLVRKNPNFQDDELNGVAGVGKRKPPVGGVLPKIPSSGQQSKVSASQPRGTKKAVDASPSGVTRANSVKGVDDMGVQGTKVEKQPRVKDDNEQIEEFFENRVLKPLPDYSWNPELRELAMTIQNDIINNNPNVRFANIVGLDDAKRLLKEAVLMPMRYPHFFQGILEPWKGILLFGPPGTGKTMLAKAVATECRTTFFNVSASTIVSKWRGDSEKLIRLLFELARYHQPSTIFVDEIDSIMSSRSGGEHEASRRMKTEILIQLDGLIKASNERVFLLAASNLPWELDMALLRRLEKRILVTLPNEPAREGMLRANIPPQMCVKDMDYTAFAKVLEGYSGSDIRLVCKEAAMKPVRRLMNQIEAVTEFETINWSQQVDPRQTPGPEPIQNEDLAQAIQSTKSSAQVVKLESYTKWMNEFGSV